MGLPQRPHWMGMRDGTSDPSAFERPSSALSCASLEHASLSLLAKRLLHVLACLAFLP